MSPSVRRKEFRVPSDLGAVQKASAKALSFLKPLGADPSILFDIRLCLEEALINAIKYGNRFQKDRRVRLEVVFDRRKVEISVEDEGAGFDPQRLEDCTKNRNLLKNCGRGIYLMHRLMDEVQYNTRGNGVRMTKWIK